MMGMIEEYRETIDVELNKAYGVANKARRKGFDPEEEVEIPLAKNMAERVEGLISVIAPQIKETRFVRRIGELEKKYGQQDWRVSFAIALETARENFCKFKDKKEAIEVGMRVGLAYITNGVVASPLEGFTRLGIKKRRDGKEYFALYFAGPIRSAGTTAICIFVALADYLRKQFGYSEYDPSEDEIKRMITELYDFHERVTNLQYLPSEEEIDFMVRNLPVQIEGEPTEKYKVSNYRDMERIDTDIIRNGVALVIGEGLTQKGKKFWGKFSRWYNEFEMNHWKFLEGFVNLQEDIRAKKKVVDKEKIKPDYGYIKDLVAGRPVFTHPLAKGGFRLRYGRCRNSGFSGTAIHPASMVVLDDFIAIGTQLKVERPGKATVVASCDSIEGPIVKLNNGNVLFLETEEEARKVVKDVDEILYLGDILINYGDFFNRGQRLVPCGYCEEFWMLESGSKKREINLEEAIEFCGKGKPLHPRYTFHWKEVDKGQFFNLIDWLKKGKNDKKIILPYSYDVDIDLEDKDPKRVLELLGIPHKLRGREHIIIEYPWSKALMFSLGDNLEIKSEKEDVLEIVNDVSGVVIRDKSGTTIGARMGRPEKAKMRKMTGSPQVLFPVGNEGGRMRSFQCALETGRITAEFPLFYCYKCDKEEIYGVCKECGTKTVRKYYSQSLGLIDDVSLDKEAASYKKRGINIGEYFEDALKILKTRHYPELIKGVRGTSNAEHIIEHLVKGVLRARHGLYVNKDGTVRYDMTETAITHFRPNEIGTSVERLKSLGYLRDIYGNELVRDDQLLEIRPQDVILPSCDETLDEKAEDVLSNVANFIDDLLVKLYNEKKFYDLKNKKDLVGHLIVGMSPHTSAGVIGRIVGFSNTQGFYCHPYFHSLMRRDCVYPSTKLFFYDVDTGQIFYDDIGTYVENLISCGSKLKKLDAYGTLSVECKKNLFTLGIDPYTHDLKKKRIKYFIKGPETKKWIKITTATNREYIMTSTHKFMYIEGDKFKFKDAKEIREDDMIPILGNFNFNSEVESIDLIKLFKENLSQKEQGQIWVIDGNDKRELLAFVGNVNGNTSKLRHKFSKHEIPAKLKIDESLLRIFGYYSSEGYARQNRIVSQVSFRICDKNVQEHLIRIIKDTFNITPNLGEENSNITICSKLIYYLFICLGVGTGAYEKRVPAFIFGLNKELVKEYISAFFEGDGSVIKKPSRIVFYSVSRSLLDDIALLLTKFSIIGRYFRTEARLPGMRVLERYNQPGKQPKKHVLNHLILGVYDSFRLGQILNLVSEKEMALAYLKNVEKRYISYNRKQIPLVAQSDYLIDYVKKVEIVKDTKNSYCVEIDWKELGDRNVLWGEQIINTRCDGDEACVILLMDALLNFSRKYIPGHRGAKQDEPLVLSSYLIPSEVDDMVFDMDIVDKYSLEFYKAALEYKYPWDVKIKTVKDVLGTEKEFEGFLFTHDTKDINRGVVCSSYKSIPTMMEKVEGQMGVCEKIRAVDESDVARLVIERHFVRDIKGNLRKFSMQEFRCIDCNEKYRRPPLKGSCVKCGGRLIFTIAYGSVVKYLEPSLFLADRYNLPTYLKQTLELTKQRIESIFGKDNEKQEGLVKWFGSKK